MHAPADELVSDTVQPTELRRRWIGLSLRWRLILGGILVTVVAVLWYYLGTGRYVSTDDASIQAAQTTISANVSGRVVDLAVHDNQVVHRGDLLFRLDDKPLQIALEDAQAKLAMARLQIVAGRAAYRQQQANLTAAQGTLMPEASSSCWPPASARAPSSIRPSTRSSWPRPRPLRPSSR
jgi:membrane fusion protein, multidrug efflux system